MIKMVICQNHRLQCSERLPPVLVDLPASSQLPKWSAPISYENVPKEYRVKKFYFEYDPEIIAKLQERVLLCREYINQLTNK